MSQDPRIIGARPGYAVWMTDGLWGTSVWGPHTRDDSERFYVDVERALSLIEAPCDYLADTYRMRLGDHDWRSVTRGLSWARDHRERLEQCTRRWVAVVPNSVMGWAIVGSQRMIGVRYQSLAAPNIERALQLLGRDDAAALAPWLLTLPDDVHLQTAEIGRLRELLQTSPGTTLALAARALGIGERSLQRTLAAHGTTFRAEQLLVRARCSRS